MGSKRRSRLSELGEMGGKDFLVTVNYMIGTKTLHSHQRINERVRYSR
jgi:hypothetical protein